MDRMFLDRQFLLRSKASLLPGLAAAVLGAAAVVQAAPEVQVSFSQAGGQ